MSSEVLAALLGAVAAGIFQTILAEANRRREAQSVLTALCCEVVTVCDLLRSLQFERELRQIIQRLERGQEVGAYHLDIRSEYFSVFDAMSQNFGQLRAQEVILLVRFNTFCKTLKDGLAPGAVFENGGLQETRVETFREILALLLSTLRTGDEIAALPRNPIVAMSHKGRAGQSRRTRS